MIKHGPVDVLVLAAGEPRFDGNVLEELKRQAASGTIRVLDASQGSASLSTWRSFRQLRPQPWALSKPGRAACLTLRMPPRYTKAWCPARLWSPWLSSIPGRWPW